jgi:hypothetical protein
MEITDLDGTYLVTTATDHQSPIAKKSDGLTEIRSGWTERTDEAGCLWTTQLAILSENEVEFISTADPSAANGDFCLTDKNGNLTRQPVTYQSILRMDRKGEKIRLSGKIEHGHITTVITLMKQV